MTYVKENENLWCAISSRNFTLYNSHNSSDFMNIWTSMQELILILCFTNYPFYFWPSWKSNAQSQKYWKPKTVDSHSDSLYGVKYAYQWASYWASFDRKALTTYSYLQGYFGTITEHWVKKRTGWKTLHFGAIWDKQRHMYDLRVCTRRVRKVKIQRS